MSFDSHSLDRLRKLGRELPKALPIPPSHNKLPTNNNLHQVETEEDPHQLFHSLMDISPDGNVPPHLVSRLKETESKKQLKDFHTTSSQSAKSPTLSTNSSQELKTNEEDALYTSFQSFLLEEEL